MLEGDFDFLSNDRYFKIIDLEEDIIELFELRDDRVIKQDKFQCTVQ